LRAAVITAALAADSTVAAVVVVSMVVAVVTVVADIGKSSPKVECKSGCGFHSRSRFLLVSDQQTTGRGTDRS
jgi:hypothetical protein